MFALRMRVSMSATGSVMTMDAPPPSPGRLRDAGDLPRVRQLAETDAAQHESAEHGSLPSAPLAPRIGAHAELGAPPLLVHQCLLRHLSALSPSPTRRWRTPPPSPRRGTRAPAATRAPRRRPSPWSRS